MGNNLILNRSLAMIIRVLLLVSFASAHISLTFPPARYPPLDFLDNVRTQQPCGVPRPLVPRYTDLYVGETYNITWRMQYLHKGGYRITLLNEDGQTVEQIAPANDSEDFAQSNNNTVRKAPYKPKSACKNCILRIERQSLEWGTGYRFVSCADVNIIGEEPNSEDLCSSNGIFKDGECECKHLYSGEICQFKDDCSTDDDCLNGGKCIEQKNSLISKTCFCAFGYFGTSCSQTMLNKPDKDECFNYQTPLKEDQYPSYGLFKADCYKKHSLNKDDFVYSRVVKNELEVIMDYKDTSWVSIGWRPVGINKSCRLFPDLENIKWKRSVRRSTTKGNNETQQELSESALHTVDPKKLRPVAKAQQPKSNGFLEAALDAPLHPMDCTDIITAAVVDDRLRISDMYSRDRSTPLVDTWVEGEESLTAAYGIEKNGRTIVMFRREIPEIEPSDHPLGPGKIFVIYAKGKSTVSNENGKHNLTDEEKQQNSFYHNDELSYHGTNRGSTTLEFVSQEEYHKPSFWSPLHKESDSPSPKTQNGAASESEEKASSEVEPKAEPEPEPAAVPKPDANSNPVDNEKSKSSSAKESEDPETGPESEPDPELQPEQKVGTKLHAQPVPEPEPEPAPEPQPRPKPTPGSEINGTSNPHSELEANTVLGLSAKPKIQASQEPGSNAIGNGIKQTSVAVNNWGGLHFAPLFFLSFIISSVFLL